jgi:hypothetical protein
MPILLEKDISRGNYLTFSKFSAEQRKKRNKKVFLLTLSRTDNYNNKSFN